ncbi:GlxA family transcriptional regulator [Methylocystis sp. JAN1]|uniref:GlxA family transcriptional regulator n=1 Tax=Methylocystis sp. JAN1 TaxID=3397211 RepID=UPI003FA21A6F
MTRVTPPFDPVVFEREADRSAVQRTRRIGFLIYPDFEILDLCGPLDAFYYAERSLGMTGRIKEPGYQTVVIAPRKGLVKAKCGLEILAAHDFSEIAGGLDTLIVSGGEGVMTACADEALVDWIKAMSCRVRRVASICNGAFLLARAGLLNNRKVTTHWLYSDRLAAAHPTVNVEPNLIFVRDGGVYTSGGVTAGIDLALALIEEDLGREVPRMIAAVMVVFLRRPGGQAQFSPFLQGEASNCRDIVELKSWILGNAGESLTVERLAAKVAMSPRNFARRFHAEVGMTPARFVEYARVEAARCRLEQSDLTLQTIAESCGFATPERMRRAFRRSLGVSPYDYRERFQSTL